MVIAIKTMRDKLILGHVALRNVWCNLRCNRGTKFRDKLKEKFPSVTVP